MNPLFNLLGGNKNPMMDKVRTIAQTLKGNPASLLQNNPQTQQMIAQYGSPQKAFYALAQQMGIDPNEVMKHLGM